MKDDRLLKNKNLHDSLILTHLFTNRSKSDYRKYVTKL